MTTFNKGIRTQAGKDLANRVMAGKTSITYSRLVFSSEDLSDKSDDELSELTDVEPQELAVEPDTIDLKATDVTDPETEVRAIAKNDPLTAGLHVRTYGLYAKDDSGDEILFGVALDDNPAYLPPHESGDQDQYLTYEWDTALKDTDNIKFTNTKMVFVNFDELNRYKSAVNATVASLEADDTNLSNSAKADYANAAGSVSSLQDSAASYTDFKAGSAIDQANVNMESNRVSLSNSVNGLPHWVDINYTRSNVAPSLANSARDDANGYTYNVAQSVDSQLADKQNQLNNRPLWNDENFTRNNIAPSLANSAANSAKNDANGYADNQATSLTNRIVANENDISSINSFTFLPGGTDLNNVDVGFYSLGGTGYKNLPYDNSEQYKMYGCLKVIKSFGGLRQILYDNDYGCAVWTRAIDIGRWVNHWYKVTNSGDLEALQGQVNSLPTWSDENDTRQQATNAANNAEGNANNYTDNKINGIQTEISGNWYAHNDSINNLQNQVNSLKNPSPLWNGTDLNTVGVGYYTLGGTGYKNLPYDNSEQYQMYGTLRVFDTAGGAVVQILYDNDSNCAIWYRVVDINKWYNAWHRVAINDDVTNLQNQINNLPDWNAENYTRTQATSAAVNAMNQAIATANNNMETNRSNLQSQVDSIKYPAFLPTTTDLNTVGAGYYALGGSYRNSPYDESYAIYGSLKVINQNAGQRQVLYDNDSNNAVWTRAIDAGSWANKWVPVTDDKSFLTADNENDARNLSNQNPGTLVVYSD